VQAALRPTTDVAEASTTLVIRHGNTPQGALANPGTDPTQCAQPPAAAGAASTGRTPLLQVVDGGVCKANRALYANR
jgi:hypothetical protein